MTDVKFERKQDFELRLLPEFAKIPDRDPTQPLSFAILGAAGFVAPRHMEAISKIGGRIVAACDPSGAVGVLDRYAPDCRFFLYFEQFLSWLAREKETHYVVVATPNDLHVGQAKGVQEFGHVPRGGGLDVFLVEHRDERGHAIQRAFAAHGGDDDLFLEAREIL